ncbi:hypothetical protein D3272_25130 [Lichenibacterium ramalinae]|uniref:Uncharacterized protein n=1 Tax=Lichenibacterium ramalinae TaxID=2316527 RepID=A0A4Q2R9S7_9HYPH|nr:hypothetical protein D3272_25130 [Lichenibacterium ramalinae]
MELGAVGLEAVGEAYEACRAYRTAQVLARAAAAARALSQAKEEPCETCCRRTVIVSRARSPEAAQHIEEAQAAGKPSTLTLHRPATNARRAANLRNANLPSIKGMDQDDCPPATFAESVDSSVKNIALGDNRSAGQQIDHQMMTPARAAEGCRVAIQVGPSS